MKKVVIIGGNAAGLSAASQIKRAQPHWQVTVYEKTSEVSYASCGIPYYIQEKVMDPEHLFALSPEKITWSRGIDLKLNTEVMSVKPKSNKVIIKDVNDTSQSEDHFDYLVIASGAHPDAKGVEINSQRVFSLHYVKDGKTIKDAMAQYNPKHVGVIGGGYIALEMVEAFKNLGIHTTLIHRRDQLNRMFEPEISAQALELVKQNEVNLQLNTEVQKISDSVDNNKVILETNVGEEMAFDMVIQAIGVSPTTGFLADSGIELGINNSVKVSRSMQTNFPHIYAAGDVAETLDLVSGKPAFLPLALKANKEGSIAGVNIAAEENKESFPGVVKSAILKIFDRGIARTGLTIEEAEKNGYNAQKTIIESSTKPGYYPGSQKITFYVVFDNDSGKLLGCQIFGPVPDIKRIDTIAALLQAGQTVNDLYHLDATYAPPFSPVYDPLVLAGRVSRKAWQKNQ